ncbi:type II secretion system protein [uncultured Campylobacter sp.]|uniref:type II secretion system protein n=1 Tax=uncultured Campylobacter sp. TaxID=218934 RepID=UPI00262FD494|nr:prepilin-type N-terminal cleavage/methylation domain-containing protein [uncultured Campylobacter sp.]
MKKGFTMIELIFVIVILGILAAVAIPRLAATRDDAEVSKAATNIQTLITDLGSYYTSQGTFAGTDEADTAKMTNVPNPIKVKKETCLTVTGYDQGAGEAKMSVIDSGDLCKRVWAMPGVSQVKSIIASTTGNKSAGSYKFGGKGVQYE